MAQGSTRLPQLSESLFLMSKGVNGVIVDERFSAYGLCFLCESRLFADNEDRV